MSASTQYRSKTLTAWLALLLGSLGAHRFYLYGLRDARAWLYWIPTVLGLAGLTRMRNLGLDDTAASFLLPLLGLSVSMAMLAAIVTALMPDASWNLKHNAQAEPRSSGWGAVMAAVVGLFVGATILMSTLAFSGQRFFEWQTQAPASAGSPEK